MPKYQKYTWNQFDKDTKKIATILKRRGRAFDGVYGPPRGGLPLAVALSHALNIPMLAAPHSKNTLIVDDIADTGETLKKYAKKNLIATIFYHPQSSFVPTIWLRKKGPGWILFPWEKSA